MYGNKTSVPPRCKVKKKVKNKKHLRYHIVYGCVRLPNLIINILFTEDIIIYIGNYYLPPRLCAKSSASLMMDSPKGNYYLPPRRQLLFTAAFVCQIFGLADDGLT
jgi:hypothetical protein